MNHLLRWAPPSNVSRGAACCARRTASFHYVEAAEQHALHALLGADAGAADAEARLRLEWPGKKAIGGYAKPLPTRAKDFEAVRDVLFRGIAVAEDGETCA